MFLTLTFLTFILSFSRYILSGVYVGTGGADKKIEKIEKTEKLINISIRKDETTGDSRGTDEQSNGSENAVDNSDAPVKKRGRRR